MLRSFRRFPLLSLCRFAVLSAALMLALGAALTLGSAPAHADYPHDGCGIPCTPAATTPTATTAPTATSVPAATVTPTATASPTPHVVTTPTHFARVAGCAPLDAICAAANLPTSAVLLGGVVPPAGALALLLIATATLEVRGGRKRATRAATATALVALTGAALYLLWRADATAALATAALRLAGVVWTAALLIALTIGALALLVLRLAVFPAYERLVAMLFLGALFFFNGVVLALPMIVFAARFAAANRGIAYGTIVSSTIKVLRGHDPHVVARAAGVGAGKEVALEVFLTIIHISAHWQMPIGLLVSVVGQVKAGAAAPEVVRAAVKRHHPRLARGEAVAETVARQTAEELAIGQLVQLAMEYHVLV